MVGNQYPCLSLGRNHHQASKGDHDNCNDGCTWRQWGIPNIAVFAVVCCQGKGIAVNYVLFKPRKAYFMDILHVTKCVWSHGHTSDKDLRGTSRGELCLICFTCFLYHGTSHIHHAFRDCSKMHKTPRLWRYIKILCTYPLHHAIAHFMDLLKCTIGCNFKWVLISYVFVHSSADGGNHWLTWFLSSANIGCLDYQVRQWLELSCATMTSVMLTVPLPFMLYVPHHYPLLSQCLLTLPSWPHHQIM